MEDNQQPRRNHTVTILSVLLIVTFIGIVIVSTQLYRSTETIQEQEVELAQLREETQTLNQNLNTARRYLRESQNTVLERDKTILEQQELIDLGEELIAKHVERDASIKEVLCLYAETNELATAALWESFWYHSLSATNINTLESLHQHIKTTFC